MKHLRTHLAALAALVLVAGCGHHGHQSPPPVATVLLGEVEPNDSAFDANFFGTLYAGDRVRIRGLISAADLYDGFAFVSGEPLSVSFVLRAASPNADLDVCVYDPYVDDFVACFEDPFDPEVGAFDVLAVGAEFHVVVTPFSGVSEYELELVASCCNSLASDQLGAGALGAGSSLSVAPEASLHERDASRLRAYTKAGRSEAAVDDEDAEPRRARGVLLELDQRGGIEATAFDVSTEGELRIRGRG